MRIGEYYWIDRNFSHTVSYGGDYENAYPMSQDILDKYVGQIYIDNKYFQVNLGDFEKYYGRYYSYPSVLYLIKYGQVHNTYGTQIEGWRLPYSADYRQLFAMAPFNTANDPAHTTLNERDVRFALSAKAGDNPMAFDINPGGGTPYKTYWFQYSNNMYKFNMMPGGARLNGDGAWTNGIEVYNGKKGDIYHLFYAAYFAVGHADDDLFVGVVSLHDNMDTRDNGSYHLLNVRWCRPLTDTELGYKLYINSAMTDIKKLDLKTAAPGGYKELPHGYIRGFYVQYILDKANPAVTVQDIVKYAHQVQDNYVYGQTGVI